MLLLTLDLNCVFFDKIIHEYFLYASLFFNSIGSIFKKHSMLVLEEYDIV